MFTENLEVSPADIEITNRLRDYESLDYEQLRHLRKSLSDDANFKTFRDGITLLASLGFAYYIYHAVSGNERINYAKTQIANLPLRHLFEALPQNWLPNEDYLSKFANG
jgi:hypothetical protein